MFPVGDVDELLNSVRLFDSVLDLIKHERISKQINIQQDKTDVLDKIRTKLCQILL